VQISCSVRCVRPILFKFYLKGQARHRAISKLARKTNHVERFTCTLRPRDSRLVHAFLSFSKKRSNHTGASKYFICDYNLTKGAALPA
jgi:hypothetical protein